ncbi:MAG: LacI family DNA-binding transcriptional regulator [Blautia sp.]|nr:LacI family DNA-binding transcriptional regulator [Blautia sp.]
MATKVTIQDIADALGISRNTVSKALNNTGVLAEKTRERVLRKAVEMGYKEFSYLNLSDLNLSGGSNTPEPASDAGSSGAIPSGGGVIALMSTTVLGGSHFANLMLDKFQRKLSLAGYSFMSYRITEENLASMTLPASFDHSAVSGIVCVEVFSMEYSRFLLSLKIPTLFVDAPVPTLREAFPCDILLMDNRTQITEFVFRAVEQGHTSFGFIGEVNHCRSFAERYLGLVDALLPYGLSVRDEFLLSSHKLLDPPEIFREDVYIEYLRKQIESLDRLPDVFLCANDFIAIYVLRIFAGLHIRVPSDVQLLGFDNSPESSVVTPALSTIRIDSRSMGEMAFSLLLQRIQDPQMANRTIYCQTSLILRDSTI